MLTEQQYARQREQLDPLRMLEEARAIAGLADYGDMWFFGPLTHTLDRAAREVDFTAEGLLDYKALTIRFLVNRLRTQDDIRRHPEILQEDVSDPIIVIGLPRSGTTKMQRMLAAAPGVQKLFMWRMLNPARFPNAVAGQPDPRMAAAGMDSLMATGNNAVQAAHAMAAGEVDEEFVLFDYTCDPSVPGFSIHIPLFFQDDWKTGTPERKADSEAYHYVRTLLQYLQWQDGGRRGKSGDRPWILKAVMHLPHMDLLLQCFPKATLVHCHRDPRDSIASMGKLQWSAWASRANVSKTFTGRGLVEWSAAAVNRYLEARTRLKLDDRIVDVSYSDTRDDIMPTIREIYRRAGWALSDEAIGAMNQWERNNEQGKHGRHDYSMEEFGLNEQMIDAALGPYIRRFIDRK